jgi:hypothetical protein
MRWALGLAAATALLVDVTGTAPAAVAVPLETVPQSHLVPRDESCDFEVLADAPVYAGRGTDYPVIGHVYQGQIVRATKRALQGFHQLDRGGHVAAENLHIIDPARCG